MKQWARQQIEAAIGNRNTGEDADVESATRDESLATRKAASFDSPVNIRFVSYRTRLADADGVSYKALLDGLVHCGILKDDGPKYVASVTFEQVKVSSKAEEKTVVEIEEV